MPAQNPHQEPEYEEELLETDSDETEDLEGYDEEVSDEGEFGDEEVDAEIDEVEGEEEPEEGDDEPDSIIVPWHDENGEDKELEIGLDEIPDLLKNAEYGRQMAEYSKQAENYFKENQTLIAIGKGVMEDNFLREVATWRASGYSEKEIANSLYSFYNGQMENIPNPTSTPDEEFLEVDDSTKQYFQKTLEKTVTPLREQLSREQSERVAQQNLARNNEVIASAIWEEQLGSLSASEEKSFVDTFRTLYPNQDTRKEILTPAQIKAVLKVSGIVDGRKQTAAAQQKPRVSVKPNTDAVVRAKKAPAIAPGKTSSQAMRKSVSTANTREAKHGRLVDAGIF